MNKKTLKTADISLAFDYASTHGTLLCVKHSGPGEVHLKIGVSGYARSADLMELRKVLKKLALKLAADDAL